MLKLNAIRVDNLITKSYCEGMLYDIDPYIGCSHGCIYCYARYMKEDTGHNEPWGAFIDVKANAPDLIPENTAKYRRKNILISPVTDPYMLLEKEQQLTRKILKKLIPLKPHIWILTKSELVLRDIDVFKQFDKCHVGLSFSTQDEKLRKKIEPFASPIAKRYEVLKRMRKEGIGTYAFIGPILPQITDWKKIIEDTNEFTDIYMFENLKIHGDIWGIIKKWLKAKDEKLLEKYKKIYFSENDYWKKVEKEIKNYCNLNNLDYRMFFHHWDYSKFMKE
jgi:DNA repair photolyase